ncbi:glycosyltransferase family 4 protein [Eubacterium sp. MSJ-33]|uniref:glycosyltransferase family 4 protein n=1 Tax=Eubacterium sp. MSJ-33 TaxID=2841528 RepID=UPI001C74B759|nr:glycosyltransferase family 4 protein [Eubacterium sp. MSJ-33]QWT54173.1 glycosyltransferase family 4 protein [Eubacterium sp. MSJ-33]
MKIALIASDNNATSGAFLSMTNLALQLNQLGVETIIVIPPDGPFVGPGDGEAILKEKGLRYYVVPSISWVVPGWYPSSMLVSLGQVKHILKNKVYARELTKILKAEHVDLVHINTSYSCFGAFAAKRAGIPYVWHIREFLEEDQGNRFYFPRYSHRLMSRASLVIAISNSIYEKYSKVITKEKIKVIYNGIDTEQFYMPGRHIFKDSRITLCYVGGLSELKGTDDLIEACRLLNARGYKDSYRLLIAGRGNEAYEAQLRDRINQYELDNIEMLGFRTDVPQVMEQADVSIVTSRCEAFGRVTVEAMLTGNLVLGADSAGTKELLQDGKLGVLYECGNPESIKEQVIFIIENCDSLTDKADVARTYMREHMSARKNAENIYREYRRILGE